MSQFLHYCRSRPICICFNRAKLLNKFSFLEHTYGWEIWQKSNIRILSQFMSIYLLEQGSPDLFNSLTKRFDIFESHVRCISFTNVKVHINHEEETHFLPFQFKYHRRLRSSLPFLLHKSGSLGKTDWRPLFENLLEATFIPFKSFSHSRAK